MGTRAKGRTPCEFDGCDRPNHAHGLCNTHAMQQRRGVPLRPIRPPRPEAGPGLRWCGKCRQFRDEDEFGWDAVRDQPKRTCRPCHAEGVKTHRTANRARINEQVRLRKRGLTPEQFRALLDAQSGRCAICGRSDRPLDIDHCHSSGRVRGMLCGPCNRGVGFLGDDVTLLAAAIEYLSRNGA